MRRALSLFNVSQDLGYFLTMNGRRQLRDMGNDVRNKLRRTTIFLPNAMAMNLAALALQTGETQASIIRQALAAYMKSAGYEPYKRPRVRVSHR